MLRTEAISRPMSPLPANVRGSRTSAKLVDHVAAYVAAPTPLAASMQAGIGE